VTILATSAMAPTQAVALGEKAGFWIRTAAYIVDAIILGIIGAIINAVLRLDPTTGGNGINLVIGLIYFLYFWSTAGHGQTLGMRLLNLKVVKTSGADLTYTDAVIRYVGLILSFICIFIGVIWVAFDANKQGWHDKIASTYVVKTTA
jgi:uncharacterized RDD family membrane protein YckC